MSDVTTHAERLAEWSQDDLHLIQSVRKHEPTYKNPAALRADVRALLEENATLRHKESSMDTMLRVTEAERDEYREEAKKVGTINVIEGIEHEGALDDALTRAEEAEALVVSLTEQATDRPRPEIVAFAESMEREMRANTHKDEHPLSHDFGHLMDELRGHVEKLATDPSSEHAADVGNLAMLALAAGVPSTPPDHPEDPEAHIRQGRRHPAKVEGCECRHCKGICLCHDKSEDLGAVGDARVTAEEEDAVTPISEFGI